MELAGACDWVGAPGTKSSNVNATGERAHAANPVFLIVLWGASFFGAHRSAQGQPQGLKPLMKKRALGSELKLGPTKNRLFPQAVKVRADTRANRCTGAIVAGSSLACVATSDARSGNTLRSLRRIFRAGWALRRGSRTDQRRGRRRQQRRSLPGCSARRLSTAQSSRPRSQGTWGCARSGRNPRRRVVAEERRLRACRVPSNRNPKCSAEPRRIRGRTELPPASASALLPPSLR